MKYNKLAALTLAALCTGTAANAEVMIGAYLPGDGWSRSKIANFNNVVTKPAAFVNVFSGFSHNWNLLYWQAGNIVAEGGMPMISWMPIDSSRRSTNLLPEILGGQWDSYIDTWAGRLKSWVETYPSADQPRVMLRFGHEFNGTWYSYGNDPVNFTDAWRYVHDRFESTGANAHIDWVWSANYVNVDDHDDMTMYYPGDNYVDWTSLDGYNWGTNYAWTSWKSFSDIFSNSYHVLTDNYPSKPIILGEVASAEQSDVPDPGWGQYGDDSDANESKADWIAQMMVDLQTTFPAIRGISLFNITKELSWALDDTHNTGLFAFNSALYSDYFTGDYLTADPNPTTASATQQQTDQFSPFDATSIVARGTLPALDQYLAADAYDLFDPYRGDVTLSASLVAKKSEKASDASAKIAMKAEAKADKAVKKAKKRKIDKADQEARANGKRPEKLAADKFKKERDGFRNMSAETREGFRRFKQARLPE